MELPNMPINIYDVPVYLCTNDYINGNEYHILRGYGWYGIYKHFQHHKRIELKLEDTGNISRDELANKIYCRLFEIGKIKQQGGLVSIW